MQINNGGMALSPIPSSAELRESVAGSDEPLFKMDTNLPDALQEIARTLNEDFPKLHDEMRELQNYKSSYEGLGRIDALMTKGGMEKNRNKMIELTMTSAMKQMQVIAFMAWINNEMLRMQKQLKNAQDEIARQTDKIAAQNELIACQQKKIEEQQSKIESNTGRMAATIESIGAITDVVMKMDDCIQNEIAANRRRRPVSRGRSVKY